MATSCYTISGWRFNPAEPVLRGEAGERRLEDRAARVLAILCERRGTVVGKPELLAEVWGGRSVSANSVSIVVGDLRRALDDDPADPAILVTVAKRGYRLEHEAAPTSDAVQPSSGNPSVGRPLHRWLAASVAAVALVGVAAYALRPSTTPSLVVLPPINATGQPQLDRLAESLAPVVVQGLGRLKDVQLLDGTGSARPRFVVRSRLILWNGAPELAMNATDSNTHAIVWSGFAAGPPPLLARHVDDRLASLQARLPR